VDSTTTSPSLDDVAVAVAHEQCLPEYCATRRMVLIGAGVAGVAALAACGSKSSGAAASAATSTSPAGATSAAAATSASAATSAAAAGGGAATPLAQLADIPVGTAISAKDNGAPIILCQPTAGVVKGFSAICTHMGCTVAPSSDGKELDCPCHGSKYNATTGAVIHGPAPRALAALAVKVVSGAVVAA
jgi:cytochrome b6-f complex iron-sulfur subunit